MTPAGSRTFVAPGKLMIAGEYSVLRAGGEALAVAVEPGIEAEVTPADAWELARANSDFTWREGIPVPESLRFAHAVWLEVVLREGYEEHIPPMRIVTRALSDATSDGSKPGVGGSASTAVVVAAAIHGFSGVDVEQERGKILESARRAHSAAQHGQGSGYDIATVVHGGLVLWRPEAASPGTGRDHRPEATKLSWPEGLFVLAGYSGRSASTIRFLDRVFAIRESEPSAFEAEMTALAAPVRSLVRAFTAADLSAVLESVRRCHGALARWDAQRGLGIMTPEITRILLVAEEAGAAAKVSGAGGGDSVLAFARDPGVLDRVAAAWAAEGFRPFAAEIGFEGLRERRE